MTRSPISPTENPFRASPNSNICGTRLRWRFASAEHRDLFVKDPNHYAPQYDGYCAMGASNDEGRRTRIRSIPRLGPSSTASSIWRTTAIGWTYGAKTPRRTSSGPTPSWLAVVDLPEPVIVGPPCAASPPTTVVALRDGGHWVVVGGQVARDEAGNVVGKGDLQAQIEQVGKNVGACLKAGGATVKDIIFTVNHVTEPSEFDKYADLRQRYFGPPSPKSTTVRTPQLAGPDFLVQVEAFASIQ